MTRRVEGEPLKLKTPCEKLKGNVVLCPEKVARRLSMLGLTLDTLQPRVSLIDGALSWRRAQAAVKGESVRAYTACVVAQALGLPDHLELLPGLGTGHDNENTLGEWEIVEVLTRFRELSNGLQCELSKAVNLHRPNSFGRCKRYNLRYVTEETRAAAEQRLVRHPDVCDLLGRHPAFPQHKRSDFWSRDYFWVVDAWEDGETLEETLKAGPLSRPDLRRIMREIGEGLQALHEHNIIRRELTPGAIILRSEDSSVLLTDLELAKLPEGNPTVRGKWQDNPYLAPEVIDDEIDWRADLFSWGQIVYHAATGKRPQRITEPADLLAVNLPKRFKRLVARCVAPLPKDRRTSLEEVLDALDECK
jgi:serine/threonine protein kinase